MTESDPRVSTGRHVSAAAADYAREKVTRTLRSARGPVLSARVRLTRYRDPALERPVVAQANANVGGRDVRVQVTAPGDREATDLLTARLHTRLGRLRQHRRAPWAEWPDLIPHERRAAALPYFPRSEVEREVVRYKTFPLGAATYDQAVFDMEMMDYGFRLFVESGTDSVLYRTGAGYRLAQVTPRGEGAADGPVCPARSPAAAPVLDVEGAIVRLELTGWPFVFFRDRASRRGCVLYHRYDGHYGLIVPRSSETAR
ncbi:sigma 54 modulation/S30EA ribosomal C-terminal domain-containing protein [Nocardia blacklockiae]|uniref:sigma 54 modulation/S30EA ribosomal C-terminal domain-containing protein n=1 Tax=Nocardia blacklockiae TaxID=480036 RepID=UPI001895181A|nr:sigma 54 modulation/S30EA ribosomal C-terminal domain-containing protein [Nocardia blacklockiae]MBF6175617.1 sigma 54 modulation/S30EA ribosomal C-terminal domain-containing protein [Nocardia blacklockiae]